MKIDLFSQNNLTANECTWGIRYLLFQVIVLPNLLCLLPLSLTVQNLIFYGINFCSVLWILRRFLLENIRVSPSRILWILAVGLLFFLLYQGSKFALSALLKELDFAFINENDAFVIQMATENYPLMFIGTVLLVPVAEEALHRGVVFRGLYHRSPKWAWCISTFLFSLIHVAGFIGTAEPVDLLFSFLQYIPAGLCLAGAYRLSGSLLCPVLIHMAINAMAMFSLR